MTTRITWLALLLATVQVPGANQRPQLSMMFNPHEYVQPQHAARPVAGGYVFLEDDPIELTALFVNWSSELVVIPAPKTSPSNLVRVNLLKTDGDTRTEFPVRLEAGQGAFLVDNSQRAPVRWGEPMTVIPRAGLTVPLTVHAPTLPPGTYELRVTEIVLQCEFPCDVVNHGGLFSFEVRAAERLPERLDLLFRRAMNALEHGAPEDADPFIAQMLVEYPPSSAAYHLRAMRAEKQGRWREAADAYDVAAQFLESGQDRLRRDDQDGALRGHFRAAAQQARQRESKR